ncbi:Tat pathway signal sequence domain protein [Streptomyces griseosporeus]|uniref:Tat pathway signal sequence domain protein n=1 Tax=Streptomyces griseosporeus TaxID=1910 RepID=UPI0036FEC6A4
MSGIGPIEPGEGTRAWDRDDTSTVPRPRPHSRHRYLVEPLARLSPARRRAALAALAAAALLAGGGYLYVTRPAPDAPPPPPYPAQSTNVTYLGPHAVPPGTRPASFAFEVLLSVDTGPPVTVSRLAQPYAGLSLASVPHTPFRTNTGSVRKIVITMHVEECGKVPENAGLPFLDVTLRNTRAIQVQSYILGRRYAEDLSHALKVACSNDSM